MHEWQCTLTRTETIIYRLAILSDLHGDLDALRAALAEIDRLGCDQIVCAGDIVDTGPYPDETIALLRERGIPCVRGNHDRWALARGASIDGLARDDQGKVLSRASTDFLASLPTQWRTYVEGVKVVVTHATPKSDMEGIDPNNASDSELARWLEQADADVLIVGHTHVPFARAALAGKWVVNPGSLLRVAEDRPASGTFGILRLPVWRLDVHRVTVESGPR